MGIIVACCAVLGLLCVCANLLDAVGKVVIALLKYAVRPMLICMLVLFVMYCISRGG